MAKEVDAFPDNITHGGNWGSKYTHLLDGKIYRLDKGVDYEGNAFKKLATIRQRANTDGHGLKGRVVIDDAGNESIFLQTVTKRSKKRK